MNPKLIAGLLAAALGIAYIAYARNESSKPPVPLTETVDNDCIDRLVQRTNGKATLEDTRRECVYLK